MTLKYQMEALWVANTEYDRTTALQTKHSKQTYVATMYINTYICICSGRARERNSLCAEFKSCSFCIRDYINPKYSEVSLSSEKEHPDSARIPIDILPQLREKVQVSGRKYPPAMIEELMAHTLPLSRTNQQWASAYVCTVD